MSEINVHVVDYGRKNLYMRYVDPESGKQVMRSAGSRQRKDADRAAAKWEHDLREGRYKSTSKVEWKEFRERFEQECLLGLSDNYAAVMRATMNHFEKLSIKRLARVDADAISRFTKRLRTDGIGESTIRTYLKHLRAALSWAVKIKLMTELPTISLPKRARKSKMKGRPITTEEFERMLKCVDSVRPDDAPEWQIYLNGLWLSGLRLAESVQLSWDGGPICVDLSGRYPRFYIDAEGQKRFRDEYLPMTPDFAEWLLQTPESERQGRVFNLRGRTGKPLRHNTVGRIVSRIGKKAGVVIDKSKDQFATAHDLRRSFGTRWSKTIRPATLQKLMRHADIKTTMDYYVDQEADDIAADLWRQHSPSGITLGITADYDATNKAHQST